MKAQVTFSSSFFPVEPGEDEDINPGIYGKALATWLSEKLQERGVGVEAVIEEDFARLVMLHRKPFVLWIGCASQDSSTTDWQLFIAAERGLIGKLLGRADPGPEFVALKEHVRAIVEKIPDVSAIAWHPQ